MILIDTFYENNINTVVEQHVSLENVARYILMVAEVYDRPFLNKLPSNLKLFKN